MKTCEICGRPIKTGWKYCWEHRYTAQAGGVREERYIDDATEGFKIHKLGFLRKSDYSPFIALPAFFIGFIGASFINVKMIFIGMILIIISIFLCIIAFKLMVKRNRVLDMVKNKDQEYINFVKEYIKHIRKEKDFRKSLLE